MKKFLKIAVGVIVFLVIAAVAVMMYWNREQQIDFAAILPHELKHCDITLVRGDKEYSELKGWFEPNQNGWTSTPVTFVPRNTYTAPTISINILGDSVIINFQARDGGWSQVKRMKKSNELTSQCKKS